MLPDFYPIEQEAEKEIPEIYLSDLFNKTDPLWSPVLASPYLRGGKINIGSANKTFKFEPDKGIWLGAQDFNSAPFRVTMDGKVYATNVEISGKIIAGAGSEIDWSYIKNVLVDTAQIKDLAVTNAKIASGLSASKITTGTLDASIVNVINLNANNITTGTLTGITIQTGDPNQQEKVIRLSSTDTHLMEFLVDGEFIGALEVIYNPLNYFTGFDLYGGGGSYISGSGKSNMGTIELGTGNKSLYLYWTENNPDDVRLVTDAKIECHWIPAGNYNLGSSSEKWRHLYLSGNIYADGTVYSGGISTTGSCYLGSTYTYSITPQSNNAYNLGSSSAYWYNLYVDFIRLNSAYGRIYWDTTAVSDFYSIGVDYCYGIGEVKKCALYPANDLSGHLGLRAGYDNSSITRRWRTAHIMWAIIDIVKPPSANTGSCGEAWAYWASVYANTYYGKNTTIQSFQHEDDIVLLKSIKEKKEGDKVYFDVSHIERIKAENGLINLNALNGFLIGVLKQLIEKVENLESKINGNR